MDGNDKIKLAKIGSDVQNIDKSFASHEKQDAERFERTFKFVKEGFDKIDLRFDKMESKLGDLWDTKNKQEGAFGISKIIAGGIGGMLVAVIDFVVYASGHAK